MQPFSKDISKQLSMMTSVLHDINGNIKNDNDTGEKDGNPTVLNMLY